MFALNTKPNNNSPIMNYPGTSMVWVFDVKKAGVPTSEENSARLESLSHPSLGSTGVSLIIVEGKQDIIVLDDEHMKNVIVKNAIVEYDGGPTMLENVSFVNCTFILRMSPKSGDLGRAILASAATTFASS